MSLRLRLVLALAPLFLLGLVLADITTYETLHSSLLSQLDNELLSEHDTIEQAIAQGPGGEPGGPGGLRPLPPGAYGAILNADGTPTGNFIDISSPGDTSSPHPLLPSGISASDVHQFITVAGTGSVHSYRVYIDAAGFGSNDLFVAAIPQDNVDATLQQVLLLEVLVTGGLTLLMLALAWVIVRQGLRPLERMAATARSIAASDLSRRVEPSNDTTEVGRLGVALNGMLAQLEAAFAERERNERRLRHFISDASHELRTPLTSMKGYAELLQRAPDMHPADLVVALRRIEEETSRMGVLVDDLLLLARLDQGRPLQRERVDLEALVSDACADARAADPTRTITAQISAPLQVMGDELRLRQVLGNLLRNALVHTPAASAVEVLLRPEAGSAVVEVIDHGPGVDVQQRQRIFERFHRADPERSGDRGGSGLGLSIVAAVVAAHGGRVDVGDTPGGGATFRVELPLAVGPPLPPPRPQPRPAAAAAPPRV